MLLLGVPSASFLLPSGWVCYLLGSPLPHFPPQRRVITDQKTSSATAAVILLSLNTHGPHSKVPHACTIRMHPYILHPLPIEEVSEQKFARCQHHRYPPFHSSCGDRAHHTPPSRPSTVYTVVIACYCLGLDAPRPNSRAAFRQHSTANPPKRARGSYEQGRVRRANVHKPAEDNFPFRRANGVVLAEAKRRIGPSVSSVDE